MVEANTMMKSKAGAQPGDLVLIDELPDIDVVIAHSPLRGMGGRTRWRPVLMQCYHEAAKEELQPYVVKARRQEELEASTAACVSDLVCGFLLQSARIQCVEPALVRITGELASDLSVQYGYTFLGGLHYASRYLQPASSSLPANSSIENPADLAGIWYFDNWVRNIDRDTQGNLIFAQRGGWRAVAVDHSDCFGGSGRLSRESPPAYALEWTSAVPTVNRFGELVEPILEQGLREIGRRRVRPARAAVSAALETVPESWWAPLHNGPGEIERFLEERWRPVYGWLKDWDDLKQMLDDGVSIDV
ncbi:MAG: HipA family kinase [Armatimonadota bacterium]